MFKFDPNLGFFVEGGRPLQLSADETAEVEALTWYQSIPLTPEVKTKGQFEISKCYKKYLFDKLVLEGKSILGIGCHEGFQLFVAAGLGAQRIVALSSDFGLNPSISGASRSFLQRKLGVGVEYLDFSPYDLSPETVGMFDVVLCYDILRFLKHPLLAVEKMCSVASEAIMISTPIIVSSDQTPFSVLLPSRGEEAISRDLTIPNLAWLTKALEISGFDGSFHSVWDCDHYVGVAVRHEVRHKPTVEIDNCPIDELDTDKTDVLVVSCQKYSALWPPFFTLFNKYWADCPYRISLGTDTGEFPGINNILTGQDYGWSSNCLKILEQLSGDYLILFQEDFFINNFVDNARLRKIVNYARQADIGCIRLQPLPPGTGKWSHSNDFCTIGQFDDFRVSFQLSIWKRELLMSIFSDGEDPWTSEFVAARRSVFRPEPFLALNGGHPISYLSHAIVGGCWTAAACNLMCNEGISSPAEGEKISSIL